MMWIFSILILTGLIYLWYYISKKYFDEGDILFSMIFSFAVLMLCVATIMILGLGAYIIHDFLTNLLK